jgi:hypothetical protein
MKKVCNICHIEKDLVEFNKCKNNNDGVLNYCKICNNEKRRKRTAKNKDSLNAWKRNYLKNNPEQREKHLKRLKIYNEKNIKKHRQNAILLEKKRLKTDKVFLIRKNIKQSIKHAFRKKDVKCKEKMQSILGCTYKEFKQYLESKFEAWMNWENYGKFNGELNYGWDIDHIIPVSSAKTEEEIVRLNHFTNFQPLCSRVNRHIKSNKF